jgi:hypothetical protein
MAGRPKPRSRPLTEALEQLRGRTCPFRRDRLRSVGSLHFETTIAGLLTSRPTESARPGERVAVILPETHFYVEAGGQVADSGRIRSTNGRAWEVMVEDTLAPMDGLVIHLGTVIDGEPKAGDHAQAEVDARPIGGGRQRGHRLIGLSRIGVPPSGIQDLRAALGSLKGL